MGVSANTLFHFTSKESLQKIIASQCFFAQYSSENFETILPENSIFKKTFIPLTSFCDLTIIQLARDSNHTKNFGRYGIGLNKKWGIENNVSPVVYVHKNSQPSNQVTALINLFNTYPRNSHTHKIIRDTRRELIEFFKYIKPYQGRYHKGKRILAKQKEIIYYDEREWRYCPSNPIFQVLSSEQEDVENLKDFLNGRLKNPDEILRFNSGAIKYIVINKKKEISEFVDVVDKLNLTESEKNQLITKIITIEEINEDF